MILILCSIISRISLAAYRKDMDVLSTIYEIHYKDQKPIREEEKFIRRDVIIANCAIVFFTATFFISFFFGRKPEIVDDAE